MDINTDEVQSLNPPSRYSQYHRSFSLEIAVNPSETTMQRLAKSTVLWVAFGLAGWYYPRYLIANETAIATKAAPYQPTAAGDAILDFRLNEPLVHPPTIPCRYPTRSKRNLFLPLSSLEYCFSFCFQWLVLDFELLKIQRHFWYMLQ